MSHPPQQHGAVITVVRRTAYAPPLQKIGLCPERRKMLVEMGKQARAAAQAGSADSSQKNAFLAALAEKLLAETERITAANEQDLEAGRQAGLTPALLDRLTLNWPRLSSIAADLRSVSLLPDPVGEIFEETDLSNGLQIRKQRTPLGVLRTNRFNVNLDIAGLAVNPAMPPSRAAAAKRCTPTGAGGHRPPDAGRAPPAGRCCAVHRRTG
jgi:hypothetical protein